MVLVALVIVAVVAFVAAVWPPDSAPHWWRHRTRPLRRRLRPRHYGHFR